MDVTHARRSVRDLGWLKTLPSSFSTALLAGSKLRRFGSGEIVFHRDDPAPDFLGLVDGLLYCYSDAGEDGRKLTFVAHPGWWAGSIAIVGGSERRATVIARSDSTLLSVPRMHVEALARRDSNAWRYVAADVVAHYDSLALLLTAHCHPDPRRRFFLRTLRSSVIVGRRRPPWRARFRK